MAGIVSFQNSTCTNVGGLSVSANTTSFDYALEIKKGLCVSEVACFSSRCLRLAARGSGDGSDQTFGSVFTFSDAGFAVLHESVNGTVRSDVTVTICGNCCVTGTTKGSGTFKIDHPLDPENKWLYHSFNESDQMMNLYTGETTLDQNGESTITFPNWFTALNINFQYQLTCLTSEPTIVPYISQKIDENGSFVIKGDPNQELCWQVTGIRNDPYANYLNFQPEIKKKKDALSSDQIINRVRHRLQNNQ